jgi:hypothetical protein
VVWTHRIARYRFGLSDLSRAFDQDLTGVDEREGEAHSG